MSTNTQGKPGKNNCEKLKQGGKITYPGIAADVQTKQRFIFGVIGLEIIAELSVEQ